MEIAGIWIGPPWIDAPDGALTVSIDPGQAFGTGAHATTRACVELLARTGRGSLLDAGCGSGVLAVAGARLGFAPVHAVDVDEAAVEATRRNAALNGVEVAVSQLDVRQGDLPPADVLVANIELRVVEALLARWPGRRAILSGYLAEERPRVAGWRSGARAERDGWAADSLARTTV